ncbi:transketolase [Candidatus Pelagibacter ubique]|jgi:transketolase|nr:transketolase [Candidatus Pelagibacter ubique]
MSLKKNSLKIIAKKIRLKIFETIIQAGKGHIGGAFSCVDILVALYFGKILKHNIKKPKDINRDTFIFSKGHASIALYVTLSEAKFFDQKELKKFNMGGGKVAEHPDRRLPGVEVVSGSLGHGLSISAGISLANKIDNNKSFNYVLLGDGECYEGSIWEAAMFANHHNLNNLVAIVDRNNLTVLNKTENIIKLEPFADKWRAFGWNVIIVDGHNIDSLCSKLKRIKNDNKNKKPTVLIANTIKGKGASFMENQIKWHHGVPSKENFIQFKKELNHEK